jgi:putative membrane protein
MAQSVHTKAIQYFYEHQVSKTRDRTGIMIFISLFERRVEIIPDHAIYEKFGKDYWDNVKKVLEEKIKAGDFVCGIKLAIAECGKSLHEYFPIKADDENELDDSLISK